MQDLIDRITRRFGGFSLDYRRTGHSWPQPWRARITTNKNERATFRRVAYGATAHEATANLVRDTGDL